MKNHPKSDCRSDVKSDLQDLKKVVNGLKQIAPNQSVEITRQNILVKQLAEDTHKRLSEWLKLGEKSADPRVNEIIAILFSYFDVMNLNIHILKLFIEDIDRRVRDTASVLDVLIQKYDAIAPVSEA